MRTYAGLREHANARCTQCATIRHAPEHRNDRRRFLIWALMLGAVPSDRVVERVLADVDEAAS